MILMNLEIRKWALDVKRWQIKVALASVVVIGRTVCVKQRPKKTRLKPTRDLDN